MGRFEQYVIGGDDEDPHGGRMGAIDRGASGRGRRLRLPLKYVHVPPAVWKAAGAAAALFVTIAITMAVVYKGEQSVIGLPDDWSGEPDDVPRFDAIRDRVVDEGVSSRSSTDDARGPQRKAIKWLTDWDAARMEADDPFLIQRYALAVFFFSTMTSNDAMEEAQRDGATAGPDSATTRGSAYAAKTKPIHGWTNMDGWMTGMGHCLWRGVRCNHRPGTDPVDTRYNGNGEVIALNLTMNKLGGSLPTEIGALRDLRVLDVGQNAIEGKIPRNIGNLVDVITLYLGDNAFSGTIPTEIGLLTECTHLYLDQNSLEGAIPTEIGNMVSLRMLGMYENYLSGTIPDLSNLSLLRDAYLDDNDLTGPIPASITENKAELRDLRVSENKLTGQIPPEIGNLEVLNILYVHSNALTGPIPKTINKLRELDEFHAHKNKLSGQIPLELGMLRDLDSLYLDHNELSGSIPQTFGELDDVERLYLHNNKISGSIPTFLERLDDLTHLRLNDNALTGVIPGMHLERLYKLRVLHLQNNQLSGQVPEKLELLKYLEEVLIQGNRLTGSMPEGVCGLRENGVLEELQADCGDSADSEVYCDCCTACFD